MGVFLVNKDYPVWPQYTLFSLVLLAYLVLLPVSLYFVLEYSKFANQDFFIKRRPKFSYIIYIILICILVFRPILDIIDTMNGQATKASKICSWCLTVSPFIPITLSLVAYLNVMDSNVFCVCVCIGIWIAFVDMKVQQDSLYRTTREALRQRNYDSTQFLDEDGKEITDALSKIKTSFWIRNRGKFGKERRLIWFEFVMTIILYIIVIVLVLLHPNDRSYVIYFVSSVIAVCLCFVVGCVYQISPYSDNYLIRNEMIFIIKLCSIIVLFTGFVGGFYVFDKNNSNNNERSIVLLRLASNMIHIFGAFLFILGNIFWLLKKFHQNYLPYNRSQQIVFERTLGSKSIFSVKQQTEDEIETANFTMNDILSTKQGYYIFLEYLIREFACENLLFISEVVHMKAKFKNKNLNIPKKISENEIFVSELKLDPQISKILEENNNNKVNVNNMNNVNENETDEFNDSNYDENEINDEMADKIASIDKINSDIMNMQFDRKSLANNKLKNKTNSVSSQISDSITNGKHKKVNTKSSIVTNQTTVDYTPSSTPTNGHVSPNSLIGLPSNSNKIDNEIEFNTSAKFVPMEIKMIDDNNPTISKKSSGNKSRHRRTYADENLNFTRKQLNLPELPAALTRTLTMEETDLYECIRKICRKFIGDGAIYQINISSKVQFEITQKIFGGSFVLKNFGNVRLKKTNSNVVNQNEWDTTIFDAAASEIMDLLRNSYRNFEKTHHYIILKKALKNKYKNSIKLTKKLSNTNQN